MLTLHEEITVPASVETCFRYVSDFRTTVEWDATAIRAEKTTPGPVGPGSRFAVNCAAGPTSLNLDYEILEYQPWHSLVLLGRGRFFDVRDTIVFSERDGGTHISYTAEFTYKLGLGAIANQFEANMRAMGASSLRGLQRALEDQNPAPDTSKCVKRADRWVLPGVAMFSRWGYSRGLKHWLPVSRFLDGQHVVLTGANSGLGLATALALAEAGADLTLVIRNPHNVAGLRQTLSEQTGREDIAIEIADLALIGDVDKLAQRLLKQAKPIDVLINNAGALFNDYAKTEEGLERSYALLLLSPWQLTRKLHPLLANHKTPARVINVISGGMYTEKLVLRRLMMKPDRYNGPIAYARAKRALTVITEQWADTWAEDNIVVNAMHPGWADTPGVATALPTFRKITRRILRDSREGADTIVWLARASEADQVSGKLFLDREIRTPYLRSSTVEDPSEREQLQAFLEDSLPTD